MKIRHLEHLRDLLIDAGIDLGGWGRGGAKNVEDLWEEIHGDDSRLLAGPLRREVAVAQVAIRSGVGAFLIELEQELHDGRRRRRDRLPSEKLHPGEAPRAAARRCLIEELGIESGFEISTQLAEPLRHRAGSPSYPGLETTYVLHRVEARVQGLPSEDFWTEERSGEGVVARHLWGWRPSVPEG